MKKILCLLMSAVFLLSMVAVTFHAADIEVADDAADVDIAQTSNPYPTQQDTEDNGNGTYGDGYYEIPCTRFAWQQAYDRLGISLPSWGNAVDWWQGAKNAGYATGSTPQPESIAVWEGDYYGHVAYVTSVSGGNTFTVNEGGRTDLDHTDSHGIAYGYTITNAVGYAKPYDTGKTLLGFIYLNGSGLSFTPVDMGADFYGAIESISLNKPIKTSGVELIRGNRDGSDEQRWRFQRQGDQSYKIINTATGNCLDVWNGETVNGTKVWTFSSNDSAAQRWYFRYNGNGLSLVPKCAPKMALDLYAVGGSNIGLYEYNEGNGNQIFGIDYQPSFSPRNLGEKFYANIIFSKFGSSIGVNLSNRNVEPMGYTGDNNQLWLFERYDDRMYKITNVANGQCLDVWDGRTDDNTNLWTFPSNNALAQRWYFKANGSGVSLVPKLAMNKSMDCVWNSNTNTTNCAIWSSGDGNKNQIFTIKYQLTPNVTSNFKGKKYEVYNTTLAWNQAYKFCEQQGGHLVTINSQEEQTFIESLLPSCTYDRVWTGGTDVYNEGNWKWINGEEIHYSNWNDNQPDNYNNNEYVLMINKNTGKWNDINSDVWNNTYNLYSFICEYEEDINASKYSPDKTFDYNGHRYEIYSDVVDWQTAEKICSNKGGHLVSITSSSENGVVFDNIKNLTNESYWIGTSDLQLEGKWSWISGEAINYTNWNSSEPNNSDGVEDYAEINASTGKWNDLRGYGCTLKTVGFICEYDEMKPTVYLGDANGDEDVDSVDATIIQRVCTMLKVPYSEEQLMCADVDADGSLSTVDATFIQRYSTYITTPYKIGEPIR